MIIWPEHGQSLPLTVQPFHCQTCKSTSSLVTSSSELEDSNCIFGKIIIQTTHIIQWVIAVLSISFFKRHVNHRKISVFFIQMRRKSQRWCYEKKAKKDWNFVSLFHFYCVIHIRQREKQTWKNYSVRCETGPPM